MTNELVVVQSNGILTLAIDRPHRRNALSPPLLEAIGEALVAGATDGAVRAIVLRGREALPFSAGYDVETLGGPIDAAEARRLQQPVRDLARLLIDSPKPVIGAAQGFVFGAALDVFAHCDIRVAATGTRFVMPPARHGFSYPAEGLARFVALVGLSRTTELTILGEPVGDDVMLDWGFLHRRWPSDAFEHALGELAQAVSELAPQSVSSMKTILSKLAAGPTDPEVEEGYQLFAACLGSADAQEGLAAMREKRRPRFRGC